MNRKKVVIVGANFAGLSAAGQLSAASKRGNDAVDVSLVDSRLDFEWTPNIHEILSGIKTRQNLRLSRSRIAQRFGYEFIQDEVAETDIQNGKVILRHGGAESFDACLLACGHTATALGIKGVRQHAIGFRTADDVRRIRDKLQKAVTSGQNLKVTIVGGGFSGIEALGELLRKYSAHQNIRICVVEPSKRLLNGLPEVVADDVMSLARARNTEFLINRQIAGIDPQGLTLDGGTRLDTQLIIWTAGTELPGFVTKGNLNSVGCSGIPVNGGLQSMQFEQLFVAGDAANLYLPRGLCLPLKKQAYHALDMGTTAGKNILNWLEAKPLQSFSPVDKPLALAFGDLNTYLILGQTVLASPVLSAAKEAIYQLYMAQLSTALSVSEQGAGITGRFLSSVQKLLIPEISKLRLLALLKTSRVLQWGDYRDAEMMVKAILDSISRK